MKKLIVAVVVLSALVLSLASLSGPAVKTSNSAPTSSYLVAYEPVSVDIPGTLTAHGAPKAQKTPRKVTKTMVRRSCSDEFAPRSLVQGPITQTVRGFCS